MSTGRKVAVTVLGHGFAPLASLATAPIMAHALGVDGRGAVAAVTAPILLATSLGTFGLPAAVTYSIARLGAGLRGLLVRALLLTSVAGALSTVAVLVTRSVSAAGDTEVADLIALAALAIVPSLVAVTLQAVAAGQHRWGLVMVERSVTSGLRLAGFVIAALAGSLTVELAVCVLAFTPALGGVAYLGLLVPSRSEQVDRSSDGVTSGSMLGYGLRVWIGSVSGVLLAKVDQAMLAPLSGLDVLGVYVVAVTVSDLPRIVVDACRDVLFSSDADRQDDARLARVTRLSVAVTTVVGVSLAVNLWWLVPVVFGAGFAPAIWPAAVLIAAQIIGGAAGVAGIALISRGHPGVRSAAFALSCIVNVVLVILLVPSLGALGAALATLGGSVVLVVSTALPLRTRLGIGLRPFIGLRRADVLLVSKVVRRRLQRG